MKQRVIYLLISIWCFWATTPSTFAQRPEYIPELPRDFSRVDFYLQTVGTGDAVFMAFGHSLLRIVDHEARTDISYNWGVFDFREPNFLYKFLRGDIKYRMDEMASSHNIQHYRYERRSIVQDRLNLTNKQKETLYRRIIWQSHPENRKFVYHYYFDNCSTKIRDYIDEAIQKRVSQEFANRPSNETLRQAIRRYFADFPFASMGAELIMNSDLEAVMTVWQAMFLPDNLRQGLLTLPQVDDEGNFIAGTHLLTDSEALLDYPEPEDAPYTGFQAVSLIFMLPLMLAGALLYKGNGVANIGRRLLGLSLIAWGFGSTFVSLMIIALWSLSLHIHTYHNANLWLFWPSDILLVYAGLRFCSKRLAARTIRHSSIIANYACLRILTTLLFTLAYATGLIQQDVSNVVCYLGPIVVFLCFLTWRYTLHVGNRAT